ncbi:hypothetical protein U9M48_040207 [Paspalum notatum var. saurae]|uniref:Reverse transcriptase domain-containing protein n=1 Tax=Paspalum notatum var. saurae TaxID=547442 RepID=A0AAQ3XDX0_PASNO
MRQRRWLELIKDYDLEIHYHLGKTNIKEIKELIKFDKALGFRVDADGTVWHGDRICVPNIRSIQELILKEAHETAYSLHPGSEKMY